MAGRNVKRGLLYFRLDCDIFQDRKVKRLMRRWQNDGLAVLLALLCEIYRDKGYYIAADDDLIADIADTCLLDDTRTKSIYNDCVELGLFDRDILEKKGVITSKGIQARYLDIMAVLRRKGGIDAELSLISSEEINENEETMPENPEKIARAAEDLRRNVQQYPDLQQQSEEILQNVEDPAISSDNREREERVVAEDKTDKHTHTISEKERGVGKTKPSGRPEPPATTENDLLAQKAFGRDWNALARHEKMFIWVGCNHPIMLEFERPMTLANCKSITDRIADWKDIDRIMECIANRRDVLAKHTSAIATFNSYARMDVVLQRKQKI